MAKMWISKRHLGGEGKPHLEFLFQLDAQMAKKKSVHERSAPLAACKLLVSCWHLCEERVNWKEQNLELGFKAETKLCWHQVWKHLFLSQHGGLSLQPSLTKKNQPRITKNLSQDGLSYFQLLHRRMGSYPMPSSASRVLLSISSWVWGYLGARWALYLAKKDLRMI